MRAQGFGLHLLISLLLIFPALGYAQSQPPSQSLTIDATTAATWATESSSILQLDGPVTIQLDRAKLSADQAVVWIEDAAGGQIGEQTVTVALLGNARVEQPEITRSGDQLVVSARVNGPLRLTADDRVTRNLTDTPTFQRALSLREQTQNEPGMVRTPGAMPSIPTTFPSTAPSTMPAVRMAPVTFHGDNIQTTEADGEVAVVLNGHVVVYRHQPNGEFLEMQADRAVMFLAIAHLRDAGSLAKIQGAEQAVTAAYLEGDVRVNVTPATPQRAEQRLEAERVYYDFTTDRAVLTDAVIHTADLQRGIPLVVRAKAVRQLSQGEYLADHADLTASSFAVPSYSIRADKAYVREEDTGNPGLGTRTTFYATGVTMRAYNVPFFYLPAAAGSMTDRGSVLQGLEMGNSKDNGTYLKTQWGLLEALGYTPPPDPNKDIELSLRLDYYTDRGPAAGVDGRYYGGFVSPTTKQGWNYQGDFRTYFLFDDTGFDTLGHERGKPFPPDTFRGRAEWEQQFFFPDDWQLQLRTGWVSDATFREEWFEDEYNDGLPIESSIYLKHQTNNEALTFLTTMQPNNMVTNADLVQEQFEVEQVPEVGYHRIGQSLLGDQLTFITEDYVGRERFQESRYDLGEQGFRAKKDALPGQPSLGLLGVTGLNGAPNVPQSYTTRGDFRQEIDYPIALGQFKIVPYVVGRYTYYSDSPDDDAKNRGLAGAGMRINTQIWKIDNDAHSDLFDIHRVRHIIEPEVNLWTSATNVDPNHLYIYDELIDKEYDTTALQLALHQIWQTKRGGPGNYRSVDFFTFNVEANLYNNQPKNAYLIPDNFRGIFYPSLPEASIPRNSINADASWRVSDNTIVLSDAQYNLDDQDLATASIGLIAQRGARMTYYLGFRYINPLDSDIATIAATYQLTTKYSIGFEQSFDFGSNADVYTSVTLQRKFDRFFAMVSVYKDTNEGDSGFSFAIYPEGLGPGGSSDQLQKIFNKQ